MFPGTDATLLCFLSYKSGQHDMVIMAHPPTPTVNFTQVKCTGVKCAGCGKLWE